MSNINKDILDLQGLGTYDAKIKTEIGKKADDFVPIEYSEWRELTDAQKDEHNWKLLHVPDSGPEPSDVPDGKTVTPTDDVATWLECAGIDPTGFSTLSDVLADSTTLSALMADDNAVDYLVRSKTFAGIGLVPKMISNTTPIGEVRAKSIYNAVPSYPYYAFDEDNTTKWRGADNDFPCWVEYKFTSAKKVKSVKTSDDYFKKQVSYSDDGTNYTNAGSEFTSYGTSFQDYGSHLYWRLTLNSDTPATDVRVAAASVQFYEADASIPDNATAMSYIGLNNYASNTLLADSIWCSAICNSTYFESVLNLKNPTMTGNTTPSGEASASSTNTTFYPYKAFDYDNSTSWATYTTGAIGDWLRYNFVAKFVPKKIVVKISGFGSGGTYSVEGLNENSQWDTLFTHNTTSGVDNYTAILDNVTEYKDFRWYCNSVTSPQYSTNVLEMQIYGRADV